MTTPTLHGLIPLLQETSAFKNLSNDLKTGTFSPGETPLALNLLGAARPFVAAALAVAVGRPMLIITARPELALQFRERISLFLPKTLSLENFPHPGVLAYERAPWSRERVQQRISVLAQLTVAETPPIVITDARSILHPTIPQAIFKRYVRHYKVGQMVSLRFLLASWYAMGYLPVNTVIEPGQYAHRGGILDIFPANSSVPIRMELWGDEIDSIRSFDPIDQRSMAQLKEVVIPPASEAMLHRNGQKVADKLSQLDYSKCVPEIQMAFAEERRQIQDNERFEQIEFYLPYFYEPCGTLFDYLAPNTLVLIDDWSSLELNAEDLEAQALHRRDEFIMRGELPPDYADYLHTWDDLRDEFSQHPPVVLGYGLSEIYGMGDFFQSGARYGGRLHEAIQVMRKDHGEATQLLLTRQAARLAEMLQNEGTAITEATEVNALPAPGTLLLINGALNEGFEFEGDAEGSKPFHLITDAELFGWSRVTTRQPSRVRKKKSSKGFFGEIKNGDHVVHIEHGIAVYRGLHKREINGLTREYLQLEYAQGDLLFVPVHQADRVAKYIGTGERRPSVHRLGTSDWENARRRAKRAVEDIADELLELYATRSTAKGYAFSPDTPWQTEIEASFPFQETDDQLRVIAEVKSDMESTTPMDRLVIGDVGFGKTEVALRAAFKAVMDSKQVAILVPTTVLAQQHYNTFSQRLAAYPVNVEMLSRFRTAREQARIADDVFKGQVDIVVGTHRLLSKDIEFKDLGLVVIDEEQRFGVTHKEHLKKMRQEIDVLTLTATPIPRSLHMAMTGTRDMSTIDTPPQERLPIITKVSVWNDDLIRRAILRELDRSGQVFFVHNRVMSIEATAQRVQKLVPEARITIGHGQMSETQLERTMVDFSAGQYDILVCTSIIENGLDLPNVNTIIMDRADLFGLAQLYQLRGRVGRSAQRGYAYFIHPQVTQLTQEALERLEVMQEANHLGAGFRVAMRDLEIRGAGDLLGARQSGHMAAVGFDMYTKLLQKAVRDRKEQLGKPNQQTRRARREILTPTLPAVTLPLQAYLPSDYIAEDEARLQIYRRMSEALTLDAVQEVEQELRDRFGPLVEPAANLIYILRLRVLAAGAGITQISVPSNQERIVIQFPGPGSLRVLAQAGILHGQVVYGRRELFLAMEGEPEEWKKKLENAVATLAIEIGTITADMV